MDKIFSFIKKLIPKKIFKALQSPYHYLLSWSSALFAGFPSEKMVVIGITGTIGKTTTAYLLLRTLKECGFKVGLSSTAVFDDGKKEWLNDKRMTMVGRFFLQGLLAKMVKNGCQFAIVETTSEGIRQYRHKFINYDWLIFTGLYPEHIESHGGFENYKKAKGKLFEHLKDCKIKYVDDIFKICNQASCLQKTDLKRIKKTVVANLDDENAPYFLSFWAEEKIGFKMVDSLTHPASPGSAPLSRGELDLPENLQIEYYSEIKTETEGVSFQAFGEKIQLSLLGEFNAANAMAAACVARLAVKDINEIKEGLKSVKGVAGRMEKIDEGQSFTVIVDYAFEPNSLAKLYDTIEKFPHNRIINVLGSAGGGRDVARRPKLGLLVGKRADYVIITNEDPYDDDPLLIIEQIAIGAEKEGKKLNFDLFKIPDRRAAIRKAIEIAEEGDLILISGKGSEQLMMMANGEKIPWDDRTVAREEINMVRGNK
ncbi:MAG: UDP-N-acetylmuramyl-tripeptide synthetase [Patescibacteria group bacterium]|nr:UDP-N-acetylmuramyl-tripeptide synthetase [Patescibacteria group bacterium]